MEKLSNFMLRGDIAPAADALSVARLRIQAPQQLLPPTADAIAALEGAAGFNLAVAAPWSTVFTQGIVTGQTGLAVPVLVGLGVRVEVLFVSNAMGQPWTSWGEESAWLAQAIKNEIRLFATPDTATGVGGAMWAGANDSGPLINPVSFANATAAVQIGLDPYAAATLLFPESGFLSGYIEVFGYFREA